MEAPQETGKARYSVRVVYTEPEFQRRTAGAPAEYCFTFEDFPAGSPADAVRLAIREFWTTASCSRVSWRRFISRISVLGV